MPKLFRKGDYSLFEYFVEWIKLGRHGRAVVRELRKVGGGDDR